MLQELALYITVAHAIRAVVSYTLFASVFLNYSVAQ